MTISPSGAYRISERSNRTTAIGFIDYVLDKLPCDVRSTQTHKGGEFQPRSHGHVQDQGVEHVYIRPRDRTPERNGL